MRNIPILSTHVETVEFAGLARKSDDFFSESCRKTREPCWLIAQEDSNQNARPSMAGATKTANPGLTAAARAIWSGPSIKDR